MLPTILPLLTYKMRDRFTGKCKQKTIQNRTVKAIKTITKNAYKEKHLVSNKWWKLEQSKQEN